MSGFFETIRNAWKIPDLRKRLLYTLLLLLVFRIGCLIPIPGVSADALSSIFGGGNGIFSFLNIISGNSAKNATIFAMSISPYINASIIMQLLTVAIPYLERLAKDGGEEGKKKLSQYSRYATIGLALLQSFFMAFNMRSSYDLQPTWFAIIVVMASLTAGTAFLMWLGEQITEKGIGNGISLIIFAGIVSNGPTVVLSLYETFLANGSNVIVGILCILLVLVIFLALIALIIFVTEAERKIPVQYAKRVVGRKMYGGQNTNIPIKINSAGVLPIIFAMSILAFPSTIITLFFPSMANDPSNHPYLYALVNYGATWWYPIVNALLVVGFTFFYSAVYFNPKEISDNLKDNGGFIPGIRPGKPTTDYIKAVSNKTTMAGALFLAFITVLPTLLQLILNAISSSFQSLNLWFGGTSVLILVGVALETVKQIESFMLARHYKGFLE